MSNSAAPQLESPWPHRLAVLLVCLTFPLIWVGGLVTTTNAGMAVPDWPNTYGYNLFLYPWQIWLTGPWDLFIEHGHRLLASLVGVVTIALLVSLIYYDARRWMHVLGGVALAGVIGQGVLGGMRVLLDERLLAKIHGCAGPAFFAFAVALAVFTSRRWLSDQPPRVTADGPKIQRLAIITTVLAYLQLVLGAQLRHVSVMASPGEFRVDVFFHLVMAAMLLVHVVLLFARVLRSERSEQALMRPAAALMALMALQLSLGAATWVVKYSWPTWLGESTLTAAYTVSAVGFAQALIITGHVAVGSLIVAVALLITLRAMRLVQGEPRLARAMDSSRLMGVLA